MTRLNDRDRAELDRIPIPVEPTGRVAACVVMAGRQWAVAWAIDAGIHKQPAGALYGDPRRAAAAARYLNARP